MNNSKRVAIYARVSTRAQQPRTQLRELKAYAKHRGFAVERELIDIESGAKADRPKLAELFDLARKRKVDVVLVWKFDRFARSTKQLITALEEFRGLGIDFISYTENIDTSTPAGKVLFTVISAFAEFERDLIRERVRAGLDRARAEGTRLGRPGLDKTTIAGITELKRSGLSVRAIARKLGLSAGVVSKYSFHRSLQPDKASKRSSRSHT
jgi:DNA invertase Pin-like site-specific DNA recombinase